MINDITLLNFFAIVGSSNYFYTLYNELYGTEKYVSNGRKKGKLHLHHKRKVLY